MYRYTTNNVYMIKIQKIIGLTILLFVALHKGNTQDEFIDDIFLDDSFSVEQEENNNTSPTSPPYSNKQENNIPSPSMSSTTLLGITIENKFYYSPIQRDSTFLNKNKHIFIAPLKNILLLSSFIQYRNAERWFKFNFDYRLFLEARDRKWNKKSDVFNIDTFWGLELNEAFIDFTIANIFTVKIGKSQFQSGSALIVNPSNPLIYTPGEFTAWASHLQIPDYFSNAPFPSFDFPIGSKKEIGTWQFNTRVSTSLMFVEFAYLPKIETNFREFDRPYHSFLTKISYTQWDSFTPSLIYFYDNNSFIGADMSTTINDDITIHAELGISFENELRRIQKNSTINTYKITQEAKNGIFIENVVGISYTPTVDSISLFTILFETYYNGKGLDNNDWQSYIDDLSDLQKDRENIMNPIYLPIYTGLIGNNLHLYSPIRVRPLYFLLQLSRNDVFSHFSSQRFNTESTLIYSPFDTTFLWINSFEWEGIEIITLGTEIHYNFGLKGGAFTELTDAFTIQIYSKFIF